MNPEDKTSDSSQMAVVQPRLVRQCGTCSHWKEIGPSFPGHGTCGYKLPKVPHWAECREKEDCDRTTHYMTRDCQVYLPNANVDLPDTAAQDSASKSNNPAVSG